MPPNNPTQKYIPGVNVAPPGNDERVGGIAFTLALELPTPLGCLKTFQLISLHSRM